MTRATSPEVVLTVSVLPAVTLTLSEIEPASRETSAVSRPSATNV